MSVKTTVFETAASAIPPLRQINKEISGADEDRTRGLLNAIQALSQLSYSPFLP